MHAPPSHRRSPRERGQTLVLITVFMLSLLGAAAMAIDVGSWYQAKRHLQDDADAAALAGAAYLPAGTSSAAATTNFNKNKAPSTCQRPRTPPEAAAADRCTRASRKTSRPR